MQNPRRPVPLAPSIADRIIAREGGYVHHPQDRGGPTKYGITQATLSRYLGRPASAKDVAKLAPDMARRIYAQEYVAPFEFLRDERLVDLVADAAVQHGPVDAIKMIQRAAGVKADGHIGQQTLDALGQLDPDHVYEKVLEQRFNKYARLSAKQPVFKRGWMKRLEEFL